MIRTQAGGQPHGQSCDATETVALFLFILLYGRKFCFTLGEYVYIYLRKYNKTFVIYTIHSVVEAIKTLKQCSKPKAVPLYPSQALG
jgi:hypothetical protein